MSTVEGPGQQSWTQRFGDDGGGSVDAHYRKREAPSNGFRFDGHLDLETVLGPDWAEDLPPPGDAGSTFTDPTFADADALAVKLQEALIALRKTNRDRQINETQAQADAYREAADETRDGARDRFIGTMVAGGLQLAGGALSFGAGIKGLRAVSKAQGETALGNTGLAEASLRRADQLSTGGQSINAMTGGLSSFASGIGGYLGELHDANAQEAQAAAQQHAANAELSKEEVQAIDDAARAVRDFIKSKNESEIEQYRAAMRA